MRSTPLSDGKASELLAEYMRTWTKDDSKMYFKMMQFEELFDDMMFAQDSITGKYVNEQYEEGMTSGDYDLFYNLKSLSWRVYVKTMRNRTMGVTYPTERKIIIAPQYKEDETVILHEMVHAHEAILSYHMLPYFSEIVLIELYKKLSAEITDIDDRILYNTHSEIAFQTALLGGIHGTLFLLKSFDIDLRCGYKIGTVCGYGRDEY